MEIHDEKKRAFDSHWSLDRIDDFPRTKIEGARRFFEPILGKIARLSPVRVLDVGCGKGVHLEFLRTLSEIDFNLHACDLSSVAVERLNQRFGGEVEIQVADATRLPYASASFDMVFSFGVLAYTGNPRGAFSELVRVCKPGGVIGVWVAPPRKGLEGIAFHGARRLCSFTSPFWRNRFADLVVPFLGLLPTQSRVSPFNASWNQCRTVVLENFSSEHLEFFTIQEIEQWFADEFVKLVHSSENQPVSVWGVKGQ